MLSKASTGVIVALILVAASSSWATTMTFANRPGLESALALFETEAFTHPSGSYGDGAIDALLGPTVPVHRNTAIANFNQVWNNLFHATNTTFLITFTNTNLGTTDGVYGAGFDFGQYSPDLSVFVTFGDESTVEYPLGATSTLPVGGFFGITSDLLVKSIHFAKPGNQTGNVSSALFLDNLTWGSAVPEPSCLVLLAGAAVGLLRVPRRRAA